MRGSNGLERDPRVGEAPRGPPPWGPRLEGERYIFQGILLGGLKEEDWGVLNLQGSPHTDTSLWSSKTETRNSWSSPQLHSHLHQAYMSVGVQIGQKVPLAPTFLFLGILISTSLPFFPVLGSQLLVYGVSALDFILPDTYFVPWGMFYVCVYLSYITTLCFQACVCFLWPLKQSCAPVLSKSQPFLTNFQEQQLVPFPFP